VNISFAGNVVLVAGGTGGLGGAASLAFLGEGAQVIVTYRKEDEFVSLRSSAADPSKLEGHAVDVTDERAVTDFVAGVMTKYGRLDALVNTIGGYAGGIKLWDLETTTFEAMISLNLRAGLILARAVMPAMLQQRRGAFVNVAAKAAIDHAAGAAAYAASKAAAVALMDSLAADARGTGVRVNTILPSIIDTPANRRAMPNSDFAAWPKPEDIAKVILFLCSDAAKTIHGAAVPVFGNS
jgi:NAD(P)-dependent dehydrogenase (short-subunit alcohol dehydrogenase family)